VVCLQSQRLRIEAKELNEMTLQVGIVGSNGIVLGSDKLLQQYENGGRSTSTVSKFRQGTSAICCYSGDSIAEKTANDIQSHDWSDITGVESIRSTLTALGDTAFSKSVAEYGGVPKVVRKVLTVLHHEQLWLLDIMGSATSVANRIEDKAVAGDVDNTCRYFMNKYAIDCYLRPVSAAVRLAAYTILAAGEENPHGVKDLELFVIPKGKEPIPIGTEQIQELKLWFEKSANEIRATVLAPFDVPEIATGP
jgi:hypothetical protein